MLPGTDVNDMAEPEKALCCTVRLMRLEDSFQQLGITL
jgi:hypothetical protein